MRITLSILLLSFFLDAYSQDTASLRIRLQQKMTNWQKVEMIDTVAYKLGLYNIYDTLAEYYGQMMMEIAESSDNPELLAHANYLNARRAWWDATNPVYRNQLYKRYINATINLAKTHKLPYFESISYKLQGDFHSIHFEHTEALQKYNEALLIADEIHHDSLRSGIYGKIGLSYLATGQNILAFKNLVLSANIAEKAHDPVAQSTAHEYLSGFYSSIGDREKSIENRQLAIQYRRPYSKREFENLFWNYLELANLYRSNENYTAAKKSINEIMEWSKSGELPEPFVSNAHLVMFETIFVEGKYEEASAYYETHPEIAEHLKMWNLDILPVWLTALRFKEERNYDSSAYYFEKVISKTTDWSTNGLSLNYTVEFAREYAEVLMAKRDYPRAIVHYNNALNAAKQMRDPRYIREAYRNMDEAYARAGNFEEAYKCRVLYNTYTDTLASIEKQRELSILEIENENKRQQQLAKKEEERIRTRHNLQYMGITLAIAAVFTILILLGVFSTSTAVIKALGFLGFIMLFEFIVLISDNIIHRLTHGEPWKVMAIKICLIAMLFPFHHYIEKKIVHYLVTRKKISLKNAFTWKNMKSKPTSGEEAAMSVEETS